jgi:hypothetical protein
MPAGAGGSASPDSPLRGMSVTRGLTVLAMLLASRATGAIAVRPGRLSPQVPANLCRRGGASTTETGRPGAQGRARDSPHSAPLSSLATGGNRALARRLIYARG